ncbi:hypothetical protein Tco_0480217, partial [Tanacetum coccineum]
VHDKARIIKKSHHGTGWDDMHSLEACVHGSHRKGSRLHTLGTNQSGGGGLGCHEWIGIGIGRQCDHISSGLVHPPAPSKC